MNRPVVFVGGVLVFAGIAGILALRDRGGDSGPPAPDPSPPSLDEPEAPDGRPIEILCRRSRDEILVFARTRKYGRPAVGLEVRLLDAAGTVLRIGRTDEFGVLRSSIPAGTVQLAHVGDGSGTCVTSFDLPPAPPPAPPSPLPILADRAVVRPGDVVRFAVWDYGAPEGVLSFEPEDPAVDPVTFSKAEELQAGFPGPRKHWIPLEARVPDDVRPGTAIATVGGTRLKFPILPRWGPANAGGPSADGRPAAGSPPVPAPGDLEIELLDDSCRIVCREEFTVALVYASSEGRFLTHGAVPGEGREALAALFLESAGPAERRVHAIVSTTRGFLEASVPASEPHGAGRQLCVDPEPRVGASEAKDRIVAFVMADGFPVPAALAVAVEDPSGALPEAFLVTEESDAVVSVPLSLGSGGDRHVRALACPRDGGPPLRAETTVLGAEPARSPPGPSWIYEGDIVAGVEKQPPTRPAMLQFGRFVQPGESVRLWDPGIEAPRGGEVLLMLPVRETRAAVRVRVGGAIVLETAAGPQPVEHLLDAALFDAGPIEVECPGAAGDEEFAAFFAAELPVRPSAVSPTPAFPAASLEIVRELPARVAAGDIAELSVRIRCAPEKVGDAVLVIRCPLPRGAVPAEDAWAVRDRLPSPDGNSGPMRSDAPFLEGRNVWLTDEAVTWFLEHPAREVNLTLRVRFPWKGRFAAPPATAKATGTRLPSARTGGSVVVVE